MFKTIGKELRYDEMSNAELKIKMTTMENEYDAIKSEIGRLLSRMEKLDNEYNKISSLYKKRTKGRTS